MIFYFNEKYNEFRGERNLRSVMGKELDCSLEVREFEL